MTKLITQRVRDFRKNQTPSENIIWQLLRNRKMDGYKFYRQHPIQFVHDGEIRYFITDFYCHEKRLVIELDGKIHENQKEYDEYRTFVINQLGIRVFRLKNEELYNIPDVVAKIKSFFVTIYRQKTYFPSPGHSRFQLWERGAAL